jgi:hypothetical protein
LHDLLRRCAALQLAHNQLRYDKLIPIYFGNPDKPFNESDCGVILVQDKNRVDATLPKHIFDEAFTEVNQPISEEVDSQGPIRKGPHSVLKKITYPILFLLFDLGVTRTQNARVADVQVSRTSSGSKPDIWAIHSRGHDSTIFGCLTHMHCKDNSDKIFASLKEEKSPHYKLCQGNKVFSKLERTFRYSTYSQVHEQGAKRKRDGDEDIKSRDKDGDTQMKNV